MTMLRSIPTVLLPALVALAMGCDSGVQKFDFDGDGFDDSQDCDSEDKLIYPGAPDEYGDGVDQDCDECPSGDGDGIDRDCDGYPANQKEQGEDHYDCNDSDLLIHPGAEDKPNDGIDQDCDGHDAVDGDGDGVLEQDDCDDEDASVYPGATDDCGDGVDSNCDAVDGTDADGDGVAGDCGDADCDDADPANFPGNLEDCDGQDNNCDGVADEGTADDLDGDGFNVCQGADCDDFDAHVYPGARERCDGKDSDCDGDLASDEVDDDGDGVFVCSGDCDDGSVLVSPAAIEVCGDGLDNDCSGVEDDDCTTCDYRVPTDLPTLDQAIFEASVGEVICVEPGVYYENVTLRDFPLHLVGLGGRDVTVIDGGGAATVLTIPSGNDGSIVEGLTFTHGDDWWGGGIHVEHTSPTLRHLRVTDNVAEDGGGGINLFDSGAHLNDILIDLNETTGGWTDGGGIRIENGTPTLSQIEIRDNHAQWRGGGIGMLGDGEMVVFQSVIVRGNSSGEYGGGMNSVYMDLRMNNALFVGNESVNGGGMALDWDAHEGGPELHNVRVLGNRADELGGGVLLYGCDARLYHFTVAGNEANRGAGIGLAQYSWPTLDGFVISDNVATVNGGGVMVESGGVYLNYNDLWNNTPNAVGGIADPIGIDGNIAEDPAFLNDLLPGTHLWDVHLGTGAVPVGSGNPTLTNPDGTPADMGAYGGPYAGDFDLDLDGYPEWWQPGPYDSGAHLEYDCDDGDPMLFPGQGC